MEIKYYKWAILLLMVCATGFTMAAQSTSQGVSSLKTVTGQVLSAEDGEPVNHATIWEKNGHFIATTDYDGQFSISVADGTILTVSYPNLISQEIVADSREPMKVVLQYDSITPKLKPKVKTSVPSDKRAQIGTQTYTVNGVTFKMVEVEGGTFLMGATASQDKDAYDNEKPAHEVTVSSFCIRSEEHTSELQSR